MTEHLFKYLEDKQDELKDIWATGGFTGPSMEETVIRNAAAQGAASVLEEILTLDATALSEENSR